MRIITQGTRRAAAHTSRSMAPILVGAVLAVLLTQAAPYYRDMLDTRPWVAAELAVIQAPGAPPRVRYDVQPARDISGEWRAWVEDAAGNRLSRSFTGPGRYRVDRAGPRTWPWHSFFGHETGPRVPGRPFRVCVAYHLTAPTGVEQDAGPYCSALAEPIEEDAR